jgi:hypothetical protein
MVTGRLAETFIDSEQRKSRSSCISVLAFGKLIGRLGKPLMENDLRSVNPVDAVDVGKLLDPTT